MPAMEHTVITDHMVVMVMDTGEVITMDGMVS